MSKPVPPSSRTTLEQWRILEAVVHFGSYAAAAEGLHRSHSSLHQAVHKLQDQLGVQLLEVVGRRAWLTDHGAVLLRHASQLTGDARALERLAESLAMGWEGELIVSVEQLYPRAAMIRALADFHPRSRGSRVRLVEDVITGTVEAVEQQRADVAVSGSIGTRRFSRQLMPVSFIPVANPANPLFELPQPITERELRRSLHIVIADTGSGPKREGGWLQAQQRWTVDHFTAALDILRDGPGFSFLPMHLVAADLAAGRLRRLDLQGFEPAGVDLRLVLPKGERSGPAARLLAECILAHAPGRGPGRGPEAGLAATDGEPR